ncbi:MAG: hypothetical protein ACR2IN_03170 [Thermoleophilaceae bacterium]|jgi:hypothetical protein|nr:hypothetical protein [Thermoleophilaceae bacterium]
MSHRSVHGSFEFVLADPEPRLRGRVRGYQGFWERVPLRRREVPRGTSP